MGETVTGRHQSFLTGIMSNLTVLFYCLLIIFPLILSERKGNTSEVYNEHISEENYDRKIWMARDQHHFKRTA
jgi:hypothetical protein